MEVLSERTLQKIFELSNGSLILRANPPTFTILSVSDIALRRSYAKREDLIGKGVFEAFPVNESDSNGLLFIARNILNKIVQTGEAVEMRHPYYNLNVPELLTSEEIYLFTRFVPVLDDNGVVEYIVTYSTDITEEVKARQEAVDREYRLLNIILQAPIAIGICYNNDLVIETANQKMLDMVGKSDDILGKPMTDVFPEFETQGFLRILKKVYLTGQPFYGNKVKANVVRNNTVYEGYYNIMYYPIKDENQKVTRILIVAIDVTAEVESKQRLQENEDRLLMAAEISGFSSFDMDLVNKTIVYSPRQAAIFGYDVKTKLGFEDFAKALHPEDYLSIVVPAYQNALITSRLECQTRIVWPDRSIHWIKVQGKIGFNNGIPVRVIGSAIDVTSVREEEARKNDFIAMVSHELKTPLTSVKAYIQLVIERAQAINDSFIVNSLSRAEAQTNKMVFMIEGFLDIAKLENGSLRMNKNYFELNSLIAEIVTEIQYANQTHNIEIERCDDANVYADKEKIGQVLTNLLSNAIKYSSSGTLIKIGCQHLTDENKVRVFVTDEGIGISEVDQAKLFDRFYRVENERMKSVSGFGIGLYLSSQIIQSHHGRIEVDSVEGIGSTFSFNLPLA